MNFFTFKHMNLYSDLNTAAMVYGQHGREEEESDCHGFRLLLPQCWRSGVTHLPTVPVFDGARTPGHCDHPRLQ